MLVHDVVLLFSAGLVQDALNTWYVRCVTERALWRATALSGVVTALGCVVFARLLGEVRLR